MSFSRRSCFRGVSARRSLSTLTIVGTVVAVVVGLPDSGYAEDLFIADTSGFIQRLQVTSAGISTLFSRDFGSAMHDVAVNPITGDIFTVQSDADLYRLHTASGYVEPFVMRQGTLSGPAVKGLNALAFRSDGTLFAMGNSTSGTPNGLFTLDPFSGIATRLSSQNNLTGSNPGGDLVFDRNDNLFQVDFAGNFYSINQINGARTYLGSTNFSEVTGLAFDSTTNRIVGVSRRGTGNTYFTINPVTGQGTTLFDTSAGNNVNGAASVVTPQAPREVDLELGLVVDVSGSINANEFAIQMDGYAKAFRTPGIQSLIERSGRDGYGVSVNLMVFAGDARTMMTDTLLTSSQDIASFANYLDDLSRPTSENLGGSTSVQEGMQLAIDVLEENRFDGFVRTIDVSGDGSGNVSMTVAQRDRAEELGITINGIVLDNSSRKSVVQFYEDNVITYDGQIFNPSSIDTFADSIVEKIYTELSFLSDIYTDVGVYSGDTTFGPTWNRPLVGLSGLSLSGTAVPYHVQPFYVDRSGLYSFSSVALGWDNVLFLYSGSFDPTKPLVNAMIGNDFLPAVGGAGFENISLAGYHQYYLVTTGFINNDQGFFINNISGQGGVFLGSSAPEPGSLVLVAVGILGFCGRSVRWPRKLLRTC